MTFDDLKFEDYGSFKHSVVQFKNGYGASIVIGNSSYGGRDGFYELAVLHNGKLCYDTPIGDDVVGWLNPQDVTILLEKIERL